MEISREKRRSFITTSSGSPLIPINPTFYSTATSQMDEYFTSVSSSGSTKRSLSDPATVSPLSSTSSTFHSPRSLTLSQQHHFDIPETKIQTTSVIKLLLIGDAGVGKSALIIRYCHNIFEENNTKTTIGVDLKVKEVNIDGGFFKAVLWDTAGQERYRNVIPSLYKGTNGVLLTYDVTDRDSFDALKHWIKECYDNCDLSRTIFYLVGNKLDQEAKVIGKEDLRKLLKYVKDNYANFKINAIFEVSAKYSNLVTGLFDNIIRDLVENRCYFDERTLRSKKSIDLSTAKQDQTTNCCSY